MRRHLPPAAGPSTCHASHALQHHAAATLDHLTCLRRSQLGVTCIPAPCLQQALSCTAGCAPRSVGRCFPPAQTPVLASSRRSLLDSGQAGSPPTPLAASPAAGRPERSRSQPQADRRPGGRAGAQSPPAAEGGGGGVIARRRAPSQPGVASCAASQQPCRPLRHRSARSCGCCGTTRRGPR